MVRILKSIPVRKTSGRRGGIVRGEMTSEEKGAESIGGRVDINILWWGERGGEGDVKAVESGRKQRSVKEKDFISIPSENGKRLR